MDIDGAVRKPAARGRDDGKPALLFFSAHLGNWELPAVAATRYGLEDTVLYRRPNLSAVADAVIDIRAGCMGNADPDRPRRADQARRGAGARRASSACWSISITCAACR